MVSKPNIFVDVLTIILKGVVILDIEIKKIISHSVVLEIEIFFFFFNALLQFYFLKELKLLFDPDLFFKNRF